MGTRALIENYVLLGGTLTGDMRERISEAKSSMSTDAITEHTLTWIDPDYKVLGGGLVKTGLDVNYGGYKMRIASVELGDNDGNPTTTVNIRSLSARKLKETTGPKVMSNVSPTQYIASGCAALDIPFVGQESATRPTISRDVKEEGEHYDPGQEPSEWTTFKRLGAELGYYMFEAGNTIYFGKPSWLLERGKPQAITVSILGANEEQRPIKWPKIVNSIDAQHTVEVTLDLPYAFYPGLRPGYVIKMTDFPQYSNYYLVDSVDMDLLEAQGVTVVCSTPYDPEPLDQPVPPGGDFGGGGGGGYSQGQPGSALYFVSRALQQVGDQYVFGAEVDLDDPDPDKFDCSELVQWAAHQAGVYIPDGSTSQLNYCSAKGTRISVTAARVIRGALLFHPGHVAISLGDGRTVEAANPSVGVIIGTIGSRFTSAARVPDLIYDGYQGEELPGHPPPPP